MRRFCNIVALAAIPLCLLAFAPAFAEGASPAQEPFVPVKFVGAWAPFFEANVGEFPADIKYISRGIDYNLFLKANGMDLQLANLNPKPNQPDSASISIRFVRAHPQPRIEPTGKLPAPIRYIEATTPRKMHDATGYTEVRYKSIFPGIDLLYSCKSAYLEYYFVLSSRANLYDVVMEISGAEKLSLSEAGELVIHTPAGMIVRPRPRLFQDVNGLREEIPGGYVLLTKNRVGFDAGSYNQLASLIIDPVLVYFKDEQNLKKDLEADQKKPRVPAPW